MKKVSIVTRAYNRLEYTAKCIDNISKLTKYDNYEHVIINNNSTDGTKDWLNWITTNGIDFFKRVKVVNLEKNVGDWGGMMESVKYISNDSEYIVQLDNDIIIDDPLWLNKMVTILEEGKENICQLKRVGTRNKIQPNNNRKLKFNDDELIYGNIQRPVACFIFRTNQFRNVLPKLINTNLTSGKTMLANFLKKCVKLVNVKCYVLDGIHDSGLNYAKYPHKIVHSGR